MAEADIQGTLEAIERYVKHQCRPGSFLEAVLRNNLKEAFMCADENNIKYMFDIVNYCYNKIPSQCWGSEEEVKAWLDPEQLVELKAQLKEDPLGTRY